MPEQPVRIIYDTLHLAQFGVDVPILRVEGAGDFFPIKPLCRVLGISSASQLEKIQADPAYTPGLELFPVPTAGGPQEMVCLRKRELAWWIANLNPRVVERRFQTTVDEFKQSLMDAADARWWGVRAIMPMSPGATPRVEVMMRLSCLRCRTPHTFTSDGIHTAWEIAE